MEISLNKKTFLCTCMFLLLLYIASTGALECYFCADAGGESPCDSYQTYTDAASCKNEGFRKNCTPPFDEICMIETFSANGNTLMQIRDCSDGKTFDFTHSNFSADTFKRITNLTPNNETACVWDSYSARMVCLSMCNDPYCNGPILDMETCGAHMIQGSSLIITLFVVMHIVLNDIF